MAHWIIMTSFQLRTEPDRKMAVAKLMETPVGEGYVVVIDKGKGTRSLKQNRLQFLWVKEIAAQTYDDTESVRRFCKLTFGMPILTGDDESVGEWWDRIAADMDYETQLESMSYVEVTRLFNTRQFAEYLTTIERYYEPKGIRLSKPEDLYYAALMREVE